MRAFALSYHILFCLVWLPSLRGLPFSKAETRRSGSGGGGGEGELGGAEGGENVVRVYVGRKNLFSIKKKIKKIIK